MSSSLPDTGSSVVPWIIAAVVVLALGAGLYVWSRRRGSGTPADSGEPPVA